MRVAGRSNSVDIELGSSSTISTRNNNDSNVVKKGDYFSRNVKLLFCFFGLQVSYILWGVVQEQLMTKEYKMGRFNSASFCVFGNRFFALFVALSLVIYKRATSTKSPREAPFYQYAPSSISNSISSWAQYEALKFVSFPTQVLFSRIIMITKNKGYYYF